MHQGNRAIIRAHGRSALGWRKNCVRWKVNGRDGIKSKRLGENLNELKCRRVISTSCACEAISKVSESPLKKCDGCDYRIEIQRIRGFMVMCAWGYIEKVAR
jgi:hypothetical protein